MTAEHFRFMDLPPELRLMVYESIAFTTRHCTVSSRPLYYEVGPLSNVALVTKSLSCSILLASHAVHNEASPIFAVKLGILRKEPTRFLVESLARHIFTELMEILTDDGPMTYTIWLQELRKEFEIDIAEGRRFLEKASSHLSQSASPGYGPNIVIVTEDDWSPRDSLESGVQTLIGAVYIYCYDKFGGKGRLHVLISQGDESLPLDFLSRENVEAWYDSGGYLITHMQAAPLNDQEWTTNWQEDEEI